MTKRKSPTKHTVSRKTKSGKTVTYTRGKGAKVAKGVKGASKRPVMGKGGGTRMAPGGNPHDWTATEMRDQYDAFTDLYGDNPKVQYDFAIDYVKELNKRALGKGSTKLHVKKKTKSMAQKKAETFKRLKGKYPHQGGIKPYM